MLGFGKKIRTKCCCIPPEFVCSDFSQDQLKSKKFCMTDWMPSSHLGSKDVWFEEQDNLARAIHKDEKSSPEWAKELLKMIEAIECYEIMITWKEAALQWKSQTKLQLQIIDSIVKTICHLIKQTEVRTFMNKMKICIGKWMFTIKILQDVERFRKQKPLFK